MSNVPGRGALEVDVKTAASVCDIIWPDFVLHKDQFVVLADAFSEDYFEEILERYGPLNVERTMNTVYLQYLFRPIDVEDAVWESLGEVLCQAWVAKAERDFSGRQFIAEFQWYSDDGDPGILIEQSNWRETRLRGQT